MKDILKNLFKLKNKRKNVVETLCKTIESQNIGDEESMKKENSSKILYQDNLKASPEEFVDAIFSTYGNSGHLSRDFDGGIIREESSKDKDGFYYVIKFKGSDRCGVEFLEHEYNVEEVESVNSAGPGNCLLYRYKKIDTSKPGYLFYMNQDQEVYVLVELE